MAKVGDQETCRFQCAPGRPWNLKAEQGLIGILLKLGKDSEEMSAIFEVSGCRNFPHAMPYFEGETEFYVFPARKLHTKSGGNKMACMKCA